jgi:gliding motility-associated-like protein
LTATLTDINGCEESDALTITVNKDKRLFIPSVFTPNDDGINDIFYIFGSESQISGIKRFAVYNRWGDVMHEAFDVFPNDATKGWDGRYKGDLLNPGVFAYVAEIVYLDGVSEVLTGDVTLVR